MAHFKKIPKNRHEGKVVYADGIVDGIVFQTMHEIKDATLVYDNLPTNKIKNKSINVFFDIKGEVYVEVFVNVLSTQCVSDVAFKIQEAIRHNVESMTEYKIASVNVSVLGVIFDHQVQSQFISVKDEKEGENPPAEKIDKAQ